jgi:flagellar biosynthetic protein FliQ
MTEDLVMHLSTEAIRTTALVASPMLAGALVIGLVISVFQAITQINEATLTFIPKMVIVGIILLMAGPWIMDVMTAFTANLYGNIASFVR